MFRHTVTGINRYWRMAVARLVDPVQLDLIEQLQMHENGKTVVLDMPLTPVSSSRIREDSNNHIPPEGVPEDVKKYITNHNLYT